MKRLSAVQRRVVVLRFYADCSLDEIASLTERPLGTVKSDLHRALDVCTASGDRPPSRCCDSRPIPIVPLRRHSSRLPSTLTEHGSASSVWESLVRRSSIGPVTCDERRRPSATLLQVDAHAVGSEVVVGLIVSEGRVGVSRYRIVRTDQLGQTARL